jgi:hypothetical protein
MIQEEAVNQFQGEHLVEFGGVVSIPFEMTSYYSHQPFSFDIGPGKSARVEQRFLKISGEGIPVPDAEMEWLVCAQKELFGAKGRDRVVEPRQPLWHAHVIGILRFEQELEKAAGYCL